MTADTATEESNAPAVQYPIARPFAWYALVQSDGGSYDSHVLPLGTCTDLCEFFQFLNHIPAPGKVFDGRHAWRIGKQYWGYGVCFFEEPTRPEWEHPNNAHGIDLVYRGSFSPAQLSEAWRTLLFTFINGQIEDATGARLSCRTDRRGCVTHKMEVWTRTQSTMALAKTLCAELGVEFAPMPRRIVKR